MQKFHLTLCLALLCAITGCASIQEKIDEAIDGVLNNEPSVETPVETPTEPTPVPIDPTPPVVVDDDKDECGTPPAPTETVILNMSALWKPISESDGRLVTLLDSDVRTWISKATIELKGELLETGRFVGDEGNGCRSHHRWKKPGSGYPPGAVLVYYMKNGWIASYYLGVPAQRWEWRSPTGVINPQGQIIKR